MVASHRGFPKCSVLWRSALVLLLLLLVLRILGILALLVLAVLIFGILGILVLVLVLVLIVVTHKHIAPFLFLSLDGSSVIMQKN